MSKRIAVILSSLAALALIGSNATAVTISTVPVGDVGNAADPATGYGAVNYAYSIGTYDVTVSQYASFLNAVAATDRRVAGGFRALGIKRPDGPCVPGRDADSVSALRPSDLSSLIASHHSDAGSVGTVSADLLGRAVNVIWQP
jgi:hypothetical protein